MKTWFLANRWRLFTPRVVQVGWKKPKTNPTEGPNPQAHIWELKTLVNIKGGNFKNNHHSLGGVWVGVQAFRTERERERENGGFGSDFVPHIFPEGHARPGIFLRFWCYWLLGLHLLLPKQQSICFVLSWSIFWSVLGERWNWGQHSDHAWDWIGDRQMLRDRDRFGSQRIGTNKDALRFALWNQWIRHRHRYLSFIEINLLINSYPWGFFFFASKLLQLWFLEKKKKKKLITCIWCFSILLSCELCKCTHLQ